MFEQAFQNLLKNHLSKSTKVNSIQTAELFKRLQFFCDSTNSASFIETVERIKMSKSRPQDCRIHSIAANPVHLGSILILSSLPIPFPRILKFIFRKWICQTEDKYLWHYFLNTVLPTFRQKSSSCLPKHEN